MNRILNGCGLLLLSALAERAYAQQPVCTIVPPLAPQRIPPPGGPVTVTANCTGTPFFCSVSFPGWKANGAPVASCESSQFAQTLTTSITSTTTFTLSVQNSSGTSAPVAVTVEVAPAVTTAPSVLPSGTVGTPYSQTLSATGGSGPPYSFGLSGLLPAGLSLNSQTGVISGTPTAAGQANFVVLVADSLNVTSAIPNSISIAQNIALSPAILPNGVANTPYSQALTATNGTGPYTFTVTSGTLPNGLTLSSAGLLAGTPTAAGGTTFTVMATDSSGAKGTQTYTLNITQPPTGQVKPVSAPAQVAQPNTPLPGPLVAKVVDLSGNAVAGAAVSWTVPQGGGTLSGVTTISNAQGLVQANYTTGPGQQNNLVRVTATASGSEFVFTIVNEQQVVQKPAAQVIAPQAVLAIAAPVAQLDNIRQRLDNLRVRQNPAVTEGLKVSYNGQALPPMGAFALASTDKDGKPVPQKGGGASADQDPFERYGVFVVGDLGIGKVHGASAQSGFDYRSSGISVGGDYRFTGNHVFGAALGLVKADSDVGGNGGSQDAKGYSFSVYGSIVPAPNAYIDLALNYGNNKYDGTRRATDPLLPVPVEYTSNPSGNQFGAAASIGYQFYREALTLAPYGRVEYVEATIDAFQESGGPGALKIGKQRYKTTVLSLGGQASYAISMPWGVLMPYGRAEYQYQAGTTATPVNAQLVLDPTIGGTVPTTPVDKNYGNFSLGASMVLPGGLSGYFNYQHLFGKNNFEDNRYTLGFRFDF